LGDNEDMMLDLLIKGGRVIDPANHVRDNRDIGILDGKVAVVSSNIDRKSARKVVDAKNRIVTPGLIDMHAHVFGRLKLNGMDPDQAGVLHGVTTICDGGSTGHANFCGFREFIIGKARTDVFCLLHICNTGIAFTPEICSWQNINTEAVESTVAANRDVIKGIKLRVIEEVITGLGIEGIKRTKEVASRVHLPAVFHIGLDVKDSIAADTVNKFTREMLSLLDKNDVLAHFTTEKSGAVISPDGTVLPELKQAIQRGLVLDASIDRFNWSFEVARKALDQGIVPTVISTDMTEKSINGPVYSLVVTMSKFLAVGLSLEQVVQMTTMNPARVIGEEKSRGSLSVGMPADVSILELVEGDYVFNDGVAGKTFKGKQLLHPRLTIKRGAEIQPQHRFENAKS
jgi:dihydroorotase